MFEKSRYFIMIFYTPQYDFLRRRLLPAQLSTEFVKSSNSCVCYADGDFAAEDQVYIFYGVRTNADFLVHNGFVYPDNEHDAVKIRLGVSRSDPLYSLRHRLLQTLSLSALAEFFITPGPFPIDGKLLAFVRIFNMDQSTYQYNIIAPRSGDIFDMPSAYYNNEYRGLLL